MGHIEPRDRDKGTTYRVRYRSPSGRELSKTFRRKGDAQKFLATVEADIARGDWVDPTLGKVTLDDWSKQWLAGKRRTKPKTRDGYESLLKARILPEFGNLPINKIDREGVEAWVTDMLDEGLSAPASSRATCPCTRSSRPSSGRATSPATSSTASRCRA